MVIHCRHLVPKGYRSITLFPFIILSNSHDREDPILLNHEKIHLRQQAEMLILPFYIWYGLEFLLRLLQYNNSHQAYRNISFEREAYHHEKETSYLLKRKTWAFLPHIFKNPRPRL